MSDKNLVSITEKGVMSRRASLKNLAFVGAAVTAGAALEAAPLAASQAPAEGQPAAPGKDASKDASRPADVAMARFAKGHNCNQSVLTAFADHLGLDTQTAKKLGAGFGGGMYSGSVCGAVTGAYMALGLKYGAEPSAMPAVVRDFAQRFKARHRSVNCAELLGIDLSKVDFSNPAAMAAVKEKLMKEKNPMLLCGAFVRDAAEIVEAMLNRARPSGTD